MTYKCSRCGLMFGSKDMAQTDPDVLCKGCAGYLIDDGEPDSHSDWDDMDLDIDDVLGRYE